MNKVIKLLEKALLKTFKYKKDFDKLSAIRSDIYDLIRKYN